MDSARLAAVPVFADLEPEDLEALAAVASEVTAEAGQVLAGEGDFGHALYAIESGTVEVSRDGEPLRQLAPGDVFGEVAVLGSGRRTADVVASSSVTLIAIFKRDVRALEQRSPETGARLRQLIAGRLAAQTS
jgi:CPA1 family monovalent cation:H+ antiporter